MFVSLIFEKLASIFLETIRNAVPFQSIRLISQFPPKNIDMGFNRRFDTKLQYKSFLQTAVMGQRERPNWLQIKFGIESKIPCVNDFP